MSKPITALITTICDNKNYGTYLQSFAMVRWLEENGVIAKVLYYKRPYVEGLNWARRYWKNQSFLLRWIKIIGYMCVYLYERYKRNTYREFFESQIPHTEEYSDIEKIRTSLPEYDLYITGSDQVWNCIHNSGLDKVFFLDFAKGKKVSMASSIGMSKLPDRYKDEVSRLLKQYSSISVREKSTADILADLGVESTVVVDPTFLLRKEQWLKIEDKDFSKSLFLHKYLLVYSVEKEQQDLILRTAKQICQSRNLKLFWLSPTKAKGLKEKVDNLFEEVEVSQYISLFLHADFIVASSFHGTAFAINFEKQFLSVAPHRFNTRVLNLLELLNIKERYIEHSDQLEDLKEIDYCIVSKALSKQIDNTINLYKTTIR